MYTILGGSMNASFRDVNEKLFKEFKAETAREGLKLGSALNEALRFWMEQKRKMTRKKKTGFFDLKPWDFGPGSEKSSQEIDEVVYGGKI